MYEVAQKEENEKSFGKEERRGAWDGESRVGGKHGSRRNYSNSLPIIILNIGQYE